MTHALSANKSTAKDITKRLERREKRDIRLRQASDRNNFLKQAEEMEMIKEIMLEFKQEFTTGHVSNRLPDFSNRTKWPFGPRPRRIDIILKGPDPPHYLETRFSVDYPE